MSCLALVWNWFYSQIMCYLGIFIGYLLGFCSFICVSVFVCVFLNTFICSFLYTELGGACRQTSSSVRHPRSVWALPPRYLPQCFETGNCQVTLNICGFNSVSVHTCEIERRNNIKFIISFCGFRSMGCSMDSLVFVSSWRSPIAQAKLQVKVELKQTHMQKADAYCSYTAAEYWHYKQGRLWLSDNCKIMQ